MKIALLGDIGLFGKFSLKNNKNIDNYFKAYREQVSICDYVIGNLEIPFSREFKEFKPKSAVIGSDEENAKILKMLRLTHVNLANNHIGDFGEEGYELTKKLLKENDIEYFGIEGIQNFIYKENNKICLSGFCNMNASPVYLHKIDSQDKGVNVADADIIENTLLKAHEEGFLNVLAFHSGLEHVHLPSKEDMMFFRYLAKKTPYILYGHHPHVVQALERYEESNLFYSLGNFCFDDVYSKNNSSQPLVSMSEENKLGLIPILTIENNKVINVELIWTYLDENEMLILKSNEHPVIKKIKNCIIDKTLDDIEKERNRDLSKYIESRINSRNINWYLSRFNFRYFRLYFEIKNNAKLYSKMYLSKVNQKTKVES